MEEGRRGRGLGGGRAGDTQHCSVHGVEMGKLEEGENSDLSRWMAENY